MIADPSVKMIACNAMMQSFKKKFIKKDLVIKDLSEADQTNQINSQIVGDLQVLRLHRHAIFGDVPVSDTRRTRIPVRLAGVRCPSGVLFFRFSDTVDTPAVKKKKKNRRF